MVSSDVSNGKAIAMQWLTVLGGLGDGHTHGDGPNSTLLMLRQLQ